MGSAVLVLTKLKCAWKTHVEKLGLPPHEKSQLKELAEKVWHETRVVIEVMGRGRRI